ncbi:MAG TPA: hypothetical protein VGL13_02955 [Polyangiaceae bacterium]
MTKRTAMLLLTVGLTAVSGCSGDDTTGGTGTGGSGGTGGDSGGTGGTRLDASTSDADGSAAHPDATPDGTPDVSQGTDASPDASPDVRADATPDGAGGGDAAALVARGQYLVDHVIACPDCHTPQTPTGPDLTHYMAGNPDFVVLPNGDHLGSRNLTNDATGLKNRTDEEIKNMFLNGVRPTATGMEPLNPVMPYYVFHNMTADDANAIVAYLRTIPAVVNTIPQRGTSFDLPQPANFLDPANIPMPLNVPDGGTASAMHGRYLAAESGLCVECHSKHVAAGPDAGNDVLVSGKYFAGGEDFSAFFATTLMIQPVSKNLTSDGTTGLGTWTAQDIVKAVTMGVSKDGTGICPPMPFGPMGAYGGLTASDAMDIANYIKALPPIVNLVVDMCVFPPMPPGDGGSSEATTDGASTSDATSSDATSSDAQGDASGD